MPPLNQVSIDLAVAAVTEECKLHQFSELL